MKKWKTKSRLDLFIFNLIRSLQKILKHQAVFPDAIDSEFVFESKGTISLFFSITPHTFIHFRWSLFDPEAVG